MIPHHCLKINYTFFPAFRGNHSSLKLTGRLSNIHRTAELYLFQKQSFYPWLSQAQLISFCLCLIKITNNEKNLTSGPSIKVFYNSFLNCADCKRREIDPGFHHSLQKWCEIRNSLKCQRAITVCDFKKSLINFCEVLIFLDFASSVSTKRLKRT